MHELCACMAVGNFQIPPVSRGGPASSDRKGCKSYSLQDEALGNRSSPCQVKVLVGAAAGCTTAALFHRFCSMESQEYSMQQKPCQLPLLVLKAMPSLTAFTKSQTSWLLQVLPQKAAQDQAGEWTDHCYQRGTFRLSVHPPSIFFCPLSLRPVLTSASDGGLGWVLNIFHGQMHCGSRVDQAKALPLIGQVMGCWDRDAPTLAAAAGWPTSG